MAEIRLNCDHHQPRTQKMCFVAKERLLPTVTRSYQKLSAVQTTNVIYVITDLSAVCEHRQSCAMFAVEKEAG